MKIRLLKAARINCNAGEIVEVSSAQAGFLLSVGAAEVVKEEQQETVKQPSTKTVKKGK